MTKRIDIEEALRGGHTLKKARMVSVTLTMMTDAPLILLGRAWMWNEHIRLEEANGMDADRIKILRAKTRVLRKS